MTKSSNTWKFFMLSFTGKTNIRNPHRSLLLKHLTQIQCYVHINNIKTLSSHLSGLGSSPEMG